jgi:hypothetical protein
LITRNLGRRGQRPEEEGRTHHPRGEERARNPAWHWYGDRSHEPAPPLRCRSARAPMALTITTQGSPAGAQRRAGAFPGWPA